MSEPKDFGVALYEPQQAHAAIAQQVWPHAKQELAQGRRLWLQVMPIEDARSIQQLRFLWGVVYKETSEQARIDGQKYTPDAWHELGKRLHLPRKITKTYVAGKKRPVITTTIGTLKGASIRKMSLYITTFMAWATTDYGVQFSEALPAELRPAPRKTKARETIDADTGEILEAA